MAKVALCISGLPRSVNSAFGNIYNSLIVPNNPDIFIHTWTGAGTEGKNPDELGVHKSISNDASDIIRLYNPKKIIAEPQRVFQNDAMNLDVMVQTHAHGYGRQKFLEMIYSSWYSNQQSNLLKEQYRLENNINYDYVIRARFDINYSFPIDCKSYDNSAIHTAHRSLPDVEMTDDRFAFGPNHLMNIYCNGFNLLDYIHSIRMTKDQVFCGESIVWEMFRIFGIKHIQHNELKCPHICQ